MMSAFARARAWIRSIRNRDRLETDLHCELVAWVDELASRYEAKGDTPEAARRRALIETGGVERVKEAVRDQRPGASLDALARDLHSAWRLWRAHPWLTATAMLSLALGIGANTAVFSVVNALFLKSAPVSDPGSLVALYSTSAANPGWHQTSFKNYADLREALPVEALAYAPIPAGLSIAGSPAEDVPAEIVSGNYFELLGVRAAVGRVFALTAAEDKTADKHAEIVISDALWRRRFGSRADVVNQVVQINARPFTIVGVAPPAFMGLDILRTVDVWIPAANPSVLTGVTNFFFGNRSIGMFDVVARTTAVTGPRQLASMLQAQASRLAGMFPSDNKGLTLATRPFWQARMNPVQRDTWVRAGGLLIVVVGLVLLIACANVANLLLGRSAARRRELAVRLAIGATQRQLVRQLLVESLMLSSAGAVVGLSVAWATLRLLSAVRPAFVPASFEAPMEWSTLLFAAGIAFVIAPICGLLPALQASRANVVDGLKGGEMAVQRVGRTDFSLPLLITQSMLATVALILATLFVRSLRQAQEINLGFDADHVGIVSFDLGMLRYDNTKGPAFVRRVNDRLRAVPGIVSSAVASHVLLDGAGFASKIALAGHEDAEALSIEAGAVGLEYFRTMNIPIIAGRGFRESDAASEFGWAVVNRTMAEQLWRGMDAVGQRFHVLGIEEPYVVLGVVSDALYDTLGERRRPYFYIYYDQTPGLKKLTLHVLTAGDPRGMLQTIQKEVHAADPNLPLINARTMTDVLNAAMWVPRTGAALLLLFGSIALSLAVIGIYGVTAFVVRQRRREIGIRVALGATAGNILWLVVRRTFTPTVVGLLLGLAASYFGGRLVASLLIGVGPADPTSYATAVVVLVAAAGAASLLPAIVALRVAPAPILRLE
jgi:putative ABC transport system permease protein